MSNTAGSAYLSDSSSHVAYRRGPRKAGADTDRFADQAEPIQRVTAYWSRSPRFST